MREYERTVMSVVNLYIQPKVKQYLQTLKSRLKEEGVPISPYITQSNGGLMDAESAATSPVKTLFSGPAAGVIGAARIAASASEPNLITFDVGGRVQISRLFKMDSLQWRNQISFQAFQLFSHLLRCIQ